MPVGNFLDYLSRVTQYAMKKWQREHGLNYYPIKTRRAQSCKVQTDIALLGL